MTITATPSQISYAGDGVSLAFAIPFVFDTSADIKVILTSAAGVPAELPTGFSITGGLGSTGTCTMTVAPAVGTTLTLLDDPELTQPVDYTDNDAFAASTHEGALDRTERQVKRLHQRVDRSVRVADGDLSDGNDLLMPISSARANKLMGFDALGNPIAVTATGGADSALRTDLAITTVSNDGARLSGYRRPETGSVARTVAAALLLWLNVEDFGYVADNNAASAATNSAAIQAASTAAWTNGGGTLFFPRGRGYVSTVPLIYEGVSIKGVGRFCSTLKKTGNSASSVSDNTVRFWDSATVNNPICVLHFVNHDGSNNWADGFVEDIGVEADTTSPNTTTTVYGFFFRGMSGCTVRRTYSNYCQVGYFWGNGSTFNAEVVSNQASNTQRGFYQHFATSLHYASNYANKFRFEGHYWSTYYSTVSSNPADNVGSVWKVGAGEVSLAYHSNGCKNTVVFANGCESHNGSVHKHTNALSCVFIGNLGLDITSNYTGGSDICLWENDSNNSCRYEDNRIQTTSVTGTAGRHFMYKITSELGNYVWERNRFVAIVSDTTNTSTWANTSGTIIETVRVRYETGNYVGTLTGCTTSPTGTIECRRTGDQVTIDWPTIAGTSNGVAATITGTMPVAFRPSSTRTILGVTQNNGGAFAIAYLQIDSSGTITLFSSLASSVFANVNAKALGLGSGTYRI
jgi:hypothetical protein